MTLTIRITQREYRQLKRLHSTGRYGRHFQRMVSRFVIDRAIQEDSRIDVPVDWKVLRDQSLEKTFWNICGHVMSDYWLSYGQFTGEVKTKEGCEARYVALWLVSKLLPAMSGKTAAALVGRKLPGTFYKAKRVVEDWRVDAKFRRRTDALLKAIDGSV